MRRPFVALLLLLLAAPCFAQSVPAIEIGPTMARGAAGEAKTDRVTLKPGQIQRFTIGLTEPYTLELFAVTEDGSKPALIEDSAKKWCLYHAETDDLGRPKVPTTVCFQIVSKDATFYRCFLTVRKPGPVPPGPGPGPGPAPRPEWKYLPAIEKAWQKDQATSRPEDLHALADVFYRSTLDTSVNTTDKLYSWLGLAYATDLTEQATKYVRNALADVMVVELGSQDGKPWGEAERKRFEELIGHVNATLKYIAGQPLPPGPGPRPGPGPQPTPGPVVGTNLRVILVAESNARYTNEQVYTLKSTKLAAWLNQKCPRDGDKVGWRNYDPNQVTDRESATFKALWAEAQPKLAGLKLPVIVIKTDKTPQAVVVPITTEAETQALLEQHAGK